MELTFALFVIVSSVLVYGECSWWQNAVFYQIYPRSFKDSDDNGDGDLQGIISKLDHLKDAGVTSAWLSPIYKSPQVDAGYDISDYRAIDPMYGTMEDFEQLIEKAKELGIRIVMDIVPNHSSNEHEWFIKSENGEEGYKDYYVWADGPNKDKETPPNNWLSLFKKSAWEWSDKRKQFYLHQFTKEQPDFNFRNPKVLQEMKDIMAFWMDKGVAGFRVDATPHIAEAEHLKDEPVINEDLPEDIWERLDHIYTKDQQGSYDVIYEFREFLDQYNEEKGGEERIMMTEAYANITNTMRWFGDGTRLGAHFTFNFELIPVNKDSNAHDVVDRITNWLLYLPANCTSNWVIGNHDNHRIATRADKRNADGFNMLVHILPNIAVTYNGEEIGMEDGEVKWEQGKDPSACNGPPENFDAVSRDFERTPFQWDDTKNAGFSGADETWLPVSSKYTETNLKLQEKTKNSHFKIYQALTKLRLNEDVLKSGKLHIWSLNENLIAVRRFKDDENIILLFNMGDDCQSVNLRELVPSISNKVKVILSSNEGTRGTLDSAQITLEGHESTILQNR